MTFPTSPTPGPHWLRGHVLGLVVGHHKDGIWFVTDPLHPSRFIPFPAHDAEALGWEYEGVCERRDWQPIETAPKDGTVVDLWGGERLADCRFFCPYDEDDDEERRWYQRYAESDSWFYIDCEPTHWMLRPEPPNV